MGWFNKSSNSTTENYSQTSYSGAAGYGSASVAGDSNRVTVNYSELDAGAIDRAFAFADNAVIMANNAADAAIASANASAAQAAAVSANAIAANSSVSQFAISSGANLAGVSINSAAQLSSVSMNNSASVAMNAMSAVEQAWNESVSKALTFANVNATQSAAATDSALSFAEAAARSDTTDTTQQFIKYGSAVAAVVALAALFK